VLRILVLKKGAPCRVCGDLGLSLTLVAGCQWVDTRDSCVGVHTPFDISDESLFPFCIIGQLQRREGERKKFFFFFFHKKAVIYFFIFYFCA
jgi:hypothetical protein